MIDKLKVPKTMQPLFDTVSGLIDRFCRTHLNEDGDDSSFVARKTSGS